MNIQYKHVKHLFKYYKNIYKKLNIRIYKSDSDYCFSYYSIHEIVCLMIYHPKENRISAGINYGSMFYIDSLYDINTVIKLFLNIKNKYLLTYLLSTKFTLQVQLGYNNNNLFSKNIELFIDNINKYKNVMRLSEDNKSVYFYGVAAKELKINFKINRYSYGYMFDNNFLIIANLESMHDHLSEISYGYSLYKNMVRC